jgi:hypothetical protein
MVVHLVLVEKSGSSFIIMLSTAPELAFARHARPKPEPDRKSLPGRDVLGDPASDGRRSHLRGRGTPWSQTARFTARKVSGREQATPKAVEENSQLRLRCNCQAPAVDVVAPWVVGPREQESKVGVDKNKLSQS